MPVFWWPYLYQSLDHTFSYAIAPAYLSSWGPSLLGQITFPIGEKISEHGEARLPQPARRSARVRFRDSLREGRQEPGQASAPIICRIKIRDLNRTSLPRGGIPTEPLPPLAPEPHPHHRRHRRDRRHHEAERRLSFSRIFSRRSSGSTRSRITTSRSRRPVRVTRSPPTRVFSSTLFSKRPSGSRKSRSTSSGSRFSAARFSTKAKRAPASCGAISRPSSIFQDYERLPDRFLPSTDLSEHLLRMALDRAAGRISRDLLQPDARSRTRAFFPILPPIRSMPEFPLPNPRMQSVPSTDLPARRTLRSVFNAGLESFVQSLAGMGGGADARARARRPAPHHPAVRQFLLRLDRRTSIRSPSCSSIASSLRPSSSRSISRNTPRSTRSITGRSRASACATASKPGATI